MNPINKVICGDAKEKLNIITDNFVNLIYLDPPFFSQREYEMISKEGRVNGFNDRWHGGLEGYIDFLSDVLRECHRVLSKSGSLYLHCDWHASHYLKIELDKIFGYKNFRNEIIWKRHNAHNDTRQGCKLFGRIHDSILFYTKTNNYTWNPWYQPYPESYTDKFYRHKEPATGRMYALGDLSGPGGRAKGNPYYEFLGVQRYWRFSKKNMKRLYREGRIIQTKLGTVPKLKRYLDEMPGMILQDVWDDIPSVQVSKSELAVYPTQKPTRLLDRIIDISTNPGDIVLDPMCGSGSTLIVAKHLGRRWIGIDINPEACRISRKRVLKSVALSNQNVGLPRLIA